MWHRDTKWANAVRKAVPMQDYHKLSICKKKKNPQCLRGTVKWNAMKWGMPVFKNHNWGPW